MGRKPQPESCKMRKAIMRTEDSLVVIIILSLFSSFLPTSTSAARHMLNVMVLSEIASEYFNFHRNTVPLSTISLHWTLLIELVILEPSLDSSGEEIVFGWEYLNPFQRIMLIKVLRPDALTPSLRVFIEQQMGERYAKVFTITFGSF